MTESQPSDELIARVLAGEATQEETARLEAWAGSSPERRAHLARLESLWRERAAGAAWDVDRAWARVAAQIESTDHEVDVIPIPRAPRWTTTAWRAAAAVLVVIGAVFAWRAIGAGPTTYSTAAAEVLEVQLEDGTLVALAPSSRLEVPDDFPAARDLVLDGEAWIAVGGAGAAPFSVRIGRYTVRDIGTAFTLRSRDSDSLAVAVLDGAVLVAGSGDRRDTLRAGQAGRFGGGAPLVRDEGDAIAEHADWRNGTLAFTAARVDAVIARLAEWHGVTIRLADDRLGDRTVTVTMPTDSLDEALDVLALLLGVTVERDGSSIVLR